MLYEDYAVRVLSAGKTRGRVWKDFRCHNHDDQSASCSINCETGGIVCQACGYTGKVHKYADQFGLEAPPDSPEWLAKKQGGGAPAAGKKRTETPPAKAKAATQGNPKKDPGPVVATYLYLRENGGNHVRIQRTQNKVFWQSRWEDGAWVKGLERRDGTKVEHVLYRTPELAATQESMVLFLEGEKDADRAWSIGFAATSTAQGAGKAAQTANSAWALLKGKDVALLPDNDQAGEKHVAEVAELLFPIAKSIRIVRLPNLPDKGDLSDWLDAGGDADQLRALIKNTEPIKKTKPKIVVNGKDPEDVDAELLKCLAADGRFYARGDKVVCLAKTPDGSPRIDVQNHEKMCFRIPKVVKLVNRKEAKDEDKPPIDTVIRPSKHLTGAALVGGAEMFPPLYKVVDIPFFDKDGRLVQTPGYDSASCIYYAPTIKGLRVNTDPTRDQVVAALNYLWQEFFREFAFAGQVDRTHALCALLQQFLVEIINARSPAYLFRATREGSGKTFLAQCIGLIVYNGVPEVAEEEASTRAKGTEMRKSLDASLMDGVQGILIDNIESDLNYPWLFQYLTGRYLEPRILGKSEKAKIPNRILWMVTANNPALKRDAIRRMVNIKFDLGDQEPGERKFERNLARWVVDNRKALIEACLTIAAGWIKAGGPRSGTIQLDSYEEWSEVMGGLMAYLEVPEFLANVKTQRLELDEEAQRRRDIVAAVINKHGMVARQPAEFFFPCVDEADLLPPEVQTDRSERTQRRQWAFWLKKTARTTPKIGEYRLTSDHSKAHNKAVYSIVPTAPKGSKIEQTSSNNHNPEERQKPECFPETFRPDASDEFGKNASTMNNPESRSENTPSEGHSGTFRQTFREGQTLTSTSPVSLSPESRNLLLSTERIDKDPLIEGVETLHDTRKGVIIDKTFRHSGEPVSGGSKNRTPDQQKAIRDRLAQVEASLNVLRLTGKSSVKLETEAQELRARQIEPATSPPALAAQASPPGPPASGPAAQAPPVQPRRSRLDDDDDLAAALGELL